MSIQAKDITIGCGVEIDPSATIGGFRGGKADKVVIGDHVMIGQDVNIALPNIEIGDYTKIHRRVGIFGEDGCIIGHNCWIAQNSVLNTFGGLWMGNNSCLAYSIHVWTHAAFGELLEGCQLNYRAPVIIEDNVWVCGGPATINPGVTIAPKTIVLPRSLITKDTEANSYYGGNPAKKLDIGRPYKELTVEERVDMFKGFMKSYQENHPLISYDIRDNVVYLKCHYDTVGVFNLANKTYKKMSTPEEIEFMKYFGREKARFIPEDYPVIGLKFKETLRKRMNEIRERKGSRVLVPGKEDSTVL